jgi:hypothetical protein
MKIKLKGSLAAIAQYGSKTMGRLISPIPQVKACSGGLWSLWYRFLRHSPIEPMVFKAHEWGLPTSYQHRLT